MKQIGQEIGVNESRVSQLHARAIRRLKESLERMMPVEAAKDALRGAILEFQQKPKMVKATLDSRGWTASGGSATNGVTAPGVVVALPKKRAAADGAAYASVSRTARSKSPSRNGLASQRQPLSSRKRSASVPATSPVTKMTRRASAGVAVAIAR